VRLVRNLYDALGVAKTADQATIKKAYRDITRKFHPDKNPGDKAAEDKFKEASVAYEVLGDADKRKLYDEFGDLSLTQGFDPERARAYRSAARGGGPGGGFGPGFGGASFVDLDDARGTSFEDLIAQMFRQGGRARSVDDLLGGGRGAGGGRPRPRRGHDIEGEVSVSLVDALLGVTVPLRIDHADGEPRTVDVKVPPGFSDGGKLRVRGQGGAGEPRGDVLLTVRVKPDPKLERKGDDLHMRASVTALQAYRGGPVDVATPWGTVTVKLPPGFGGGRTVRLKGKGVKLRDHQGDLYVAFDLVLPPPGDEALLAALERLQANAEPSAVEPPSA
jgi:curved DNA-binding protein